VAVEAFPVEEAVLGALLLLKGGHGYALEKLLATNLGPIWHIASSRLYAALRRLEDKGLIHGQTLPQEGRPPRRVFTITPPGEKEFWNWAMSPVRHLRDVRVEFLAKLYFLHRLAPERMEGLINDEIAILERVHSRLARRKGLSIEDELVGRLALSFRLSQLQATIGWLRDCASELKNKKEG